MEELIGQMLLSGLVGALIGGGTNAIAIRALFRPLERAWWGWQGIIPKNQEKLAGNISQVVDEDLLNDESLLARLDDPQFGAWLQGAAANGLERLAAASPAALFRLLPAEWRQRRLERLVCRGILLFWLWLDSDEGRRLRGSLAERLEEKLGGVTLEQVLGRRRADELTERLAAFFFGPQAQNFLGEFVEGKVHSLLQADTRLRELLPPEVQDLLNEALKRALPELVQRFAQWASRPENLDALEEMLLAQIEELDSLKRLASKGAMRLFRREIESLKQRVPHYFSAYLESPEVRAEVEERIVGVVGATLDTPVRDIVGARAESLAATLGQVVSTWLGSAEIRRAFTTFVAGRYDEFAGRTLRDLLPPAWWDSLRRGLVDLPLDGARKRRWSRPAAAWLVERVRRDRAPIGRRLGTPEGRGRAARKGADLAHGFLRRRAPDLVRRFDIKGVVYRQVMRFDLHKVERMVRDLIDNELGAIVELGIFIGLCVGLLMPLMHWLLGLAAEAVWLVVVPGYAYLLWRLGRFVRALRR